MSSNDYPSTPRNRVRRLPERGSHDRDLIHAILDEGTFCHVGIVVDGQPFVVPMAYARRGGTLLLHGAASSRIMRALAGGAQACVTVTLQDGMVLARSAFHHSMNYRSVMALGRARPIEDDARKKEAFDALVEHLVPGRTRDARAPNQQEVKATTILEFPLEEVSAKVRTGPPKDEEEDMAMGIWAGVIPLRVVPGEPEPAPDLEPGLEVPEYAASYSRTR